MEYAGKRKRSPLLLMVELAGERNSKTMAVGSGFGTGYGLWGGYGG
jgi:hypothetical protein